MNGGFVYPEGYERAAAPAGSPRGFSRRPARSEGARRVLAASLVSALVLGAVLPAAPEEPPAVPPEHAERMKEGLHVFRDRVREALVENCIECHGGGATKGDLDLSRRSSLLESGVVGDDARSSRLLALVAHREKPHMPYERDRLPEDLIAEIARWLDLGAPYDRPLVAPEDERPSPATEVGAKDRRFWSFRPLRVTSPPPVEDASWARTPIDRFILRELERRGISPNPPAERRTLIRRACLDLLGVPPEPHEVESFVGDPDPAAYARLVDRLLESPRYGERWARHWMDVARFAESHGYEQDYDRKHAYHYRDFLIRALNGDMPYDRFARWQIAGDELAPGDPHAMTATGFLGAGPFPTQLTEAEFESARYDELDDMLATTGAAFLGLTIGCARCHDHKYDPIPSKDYYRMAATFTTTIRSEVDLVLEPGTPPVKVQVTSEGFPPTKHHADERGFPHFYEETYVLERGDVHQKRGVAEQGFLRVLSPPGGEDASRWDVEPSEDWTRTSFRRAALARWLTDTEEGAGALAARVIVNRLWHYHFGRGIVRTPNDFGRQGARPTHPELLEWLAVDLVHGGWRLKRLHRLIMTSAVYRQSDAWDEGGARADRENRYLWRWTPRRLEAEAIRDSMLVVSGRLDPRMYGPGTLAEDMRRRSVYFFIKRSKLIPAMMLFDWPEHLVSMGRRSVTTTAPQALMLLNSPEARRYAEGFASRLLESAGKDLVAAAYRTAVGRPPTGEERQVSEEFLTRQEASYRASGTDDPGRPALVDFCQSLLASNEFIYVD